MRSLVSSLIVTLLAAALIIAGFWYWKHLRRVTVEPNDYSMAPEYMTGSYHATGGIVDARDLVPGKAVAYHVPGNAERVRLAWVVATEGQRITFQGRKLMVNGQPLTKGGNDLSKQPAPPQGLFALSELATRDPAGNNPWHNEFRVPRGCVLLMANTPEEDSWCFGPLPVESVVGVLGSPLQGLKGSP